MKKNLLILFMALLLFSLPASAFHDHVDLDGAETLISGYRAPSETADGSTGDEVCSVCGAVIKPATRIPSLREQRGDTETTPPSAPVTNAPAATPVETPASVPTAVPTAEPTAVPTSVHPQNPTQAPPPESGENNDPELSSPGPESAPPSPVPSPTPSPSPTAIPSPVAPVSGGNAGSSGPSPTAQPDLEKEYANKPPKQTSDASSSTEAGSRHSNSSSRTLSKSKNSSRNLSEYPFFSARFPWRRLFIVSDLGIQLPLAGELVWPQPETSSPLMMLMIPLP